MRMLSLQAVTLCLLFLHSSLADVPFHRKDVLVPKAKRKLAASRKKDSFHQHVAPLHENPEDDIASGILSTDSIPSVLQHNTTKASKPKKKPRRPTDHTQKTRKLRLQREWKDAVAAGIAFDWKKRTPIRFDAPQVIWLGPISNLNEWHFSFVGLGDPYEAGIYHGVLKLPSDYPASPPKIQVWTPNGRFQTHRDLCLTVSNYHPETWKPNLTIRSIVESVRVHMMTPADNAIGSLGDSYRKRHDYASESRTYRHERKDAVLLVHHAEMIRNGWILGMTEQQTTCNDSLEVVSESTPLTSLLMTRPKLLIVMGAFCILFLFLNLR